MKTKIKVIDKKFTVFEDTFNKTIKCNLTCDLCLPKDIKNLLECTGVFKVEAYTQLREDDKFDYRKGCKIALSKAQLKAYKHANRAYDNLYTIINKLLDTVYLRGEAVKEVYKKQSKYINDNVIKK